MINLAENDETEVACGACTFLDASADVVCAICGNALHESRRTPHRQTGPAPLGRDRHGEIRSDGRARARGFRERGQEILPVRPGSNSRLEFSLGMSLQQAHDLLKQRAEERKPECGLTPEVTARGLSAVWPLEQQSMEINQFLQGVKTCIVDPGALRYLGEVGVFCGQAAAPGNSDGDLGDFGGDKHLLENAQRLGSTSVLVGYGGDGSAVRNNPSYMQKQVQNAILGWVQTGGGGGFCGEAITTEHNKCKRLDSGLLRELENYTDPMSTSSSFLSTRVPSSDPEPETANLLMSVTWGDMFILELSGLMVVRDGFVWFVLGGLSGFWKVGAENYKNVVVLWKICGRAEFSRQKAAAVTAGITFAGKLHGQAVEVYT